MITFGKKIPISIHPIFWAFAGLIGWLNSQTIPGTLIWIGIILASLLVHEMGHALTGIAFGHRARIDLIAMGGVTSRQGLPLSLGKEFLIVLNGPLAGFALCLLSYFLSTLTLESYPTLGTIFYWTAIANLFWTVLNLLPVNPLDGGKLLAIFLESLFGMKGVRIALGIGIVLSIALSGLFFFIGWILGGAIFILLGFENVRAFRSSLVLTDVDRDIRYQQRIQDANILLERGEMAEAVQELNKVRDETHKGMYFNQATELLASAFMAQKHLEEAYQLLKPIEKNLSVQGVRMQHQLAYSTGKWKDAISLGKRSFQMLPHYDTALLNAFSHAILEEVKPTIGWLECAVREGIPNLHHALEQSPFDKIRDTEPFQKFVNSQ